MSLICLGPLPQLMAQHTRMHHLAKAAAAAEHSYRHPEVPALGPATCKQPLTELAPIFMDSPHTLFPISSTETAWKLPLKTVLHSFTCSALVTLVY